MATRHNVQGAPGQPSAQDLRPGRTVQVQPSTLTAAAVSTHPTHSAQALPVDRPPGPTWATHPTDHDGPNFLEQINTSRYATHMFSAPCRPRLLPLYPHLRPNSPHCRARRPPSRPVTSPSLLSHASPYPSVSTRPRQPSPLPQPRLPPTSSPQCTRHITAAIPTTTIRPPSRRRGLPALVQPARLSIVRPESAPPERGGPRSQTPSPLPAPAPFLRPSRWTPYNRPVIGAGAVA